MLHKSWKLTSTLHVPPWLWAGTKPRPLLCWHPCVNTRVASRLVPKGRKTVYSLDPYRKSLIIPILTLYIIFLMGGDTGEKSLIGPEFTNLTRLADQRGPRDPEVSTHPGLGLRPRTNHGLWGSDSGPRACKQVASPTVPSPQPCIIFLIMWASRIQASQLSCSCYFFK